MLGHFGICIDDLPLPLQNELSEITILAKAIGVNELSASILREIYLRKSESLLHKRIALVELETRHESNMRDENIVDEQIVTAKR